MGTVTPAGNPGRANMLTPEQWKRLGIKEEIFEGVDRFYREYYLRPRPIGRIVKTMLQDKDVAVRRLREGVEFFSSLKQRKRDMAAQ